MGSSRVGESPALQEQQGPGYARRGKAQCSQQQQQTQAAATSV